MGREGRGWVGRERRGWVGRENSEGEECKGRREGVGEGGGVVETRKREDVKNCEGEAVAKRRT